MRHNGAAMTDSMSQIYTVSVAFVALAAPFVGSFLGLLVVRLPAGGAVAWGRSRCSHCDEVLRPLDLIPILSWAVLRGRCRYCGQRLGIFYPIIELLAVAVVIWAFAAVPGWMVFPTILLGWMLLALAAVDWRAFVLPDPLTLPLVPMGWAVIYVIEPGALVDHVIGAGAGFVAFVVVRLVYRRVRGREGLGLGDAKLMAGAGAWVSWHGLPTVVLFASLLGIVLALVGSLRGRHLSAIDKHPFGAYLCLGTWLVWLYGPLLGP